jgi:hypothetical protein
VSAPQNMVTLARANEVRCGMGSLLRAVRAHELSISAALVDPRAKSLTVYRLLMAQYGVGRSRVLAMLARAGRILWRDVTDDGPPVGETVLVGDLTDRQRDALVRACREGGCG